MRAIIISDSEARALLDQLKITAMQKPHMWDDPDKKPTWEGVHRAFHYTVTRWLQEMGADLNRL